MSHHEVLALTLDGVPAKNIARQLGVGLSTVYNRIKEFKNEAEDIGLMNAAKKYSVEKSVNNLMRLATQVAENNLSVSQCITGAAIAETLRKNRVKEAKLQEFLDTIYLESERNNLTPQELTKYAGELKQFTTKQGESYSEFMARLESGSTRNRELQSENQDFVNHIKANRDTLRQILQENKTTTKELRDFVKVRESLREKHLDINNLNHIENLLANIEKQGHDPVKVVRLCLMSEDLESKTKTIQTQLEQLTQQVNMKTEDLKQHQDEVEKNRQTLDSINQLKILDLTPEMIKAITVTIKKICAKHGKSGTEALEEFVKEIQKSYDPILGFQEKIEQFNNQTNALEKKITLKQEELATLEKITKERKMALESLNALKGLGVKDIELVEWDQILAENSYDVEGFRVEINKLGGLEQLVNEKTGEIARLDRHIDTTKTALKMAEDETNAYRQNIANRLQEFERTINSQISKMDELMVRVEVDFTSPETGFQAKTQAIVLETHRILRDLLSKTSKKWGHDMSNLEKKTETILEEADRILQNAYKGGQIVGKFHSLEPINRLFLQDELSPLEAKIAILTVIVYAHNWLIENKKINMTHHTANLIQLLSEELGEYEPF